MSAESPTERELYFAVLRRLLAAGVAVRTESRSLRPAFSPTYVRDRGDGRSAIFVVRETGAHWVEPDDGAEVQEALFVGAVSVTEEAFVLAHELGHHHSAFRGYEEIRGRLEKDRDRVSDADKCLVLGEEGFAWGWARAFLAELGVVDWGRFDAVASKNLATYLAMWPER